MVKEFEIIFGMSLGCLILLQNWDNKYKNFQKYFKENSIINFWECFAKNCFDSRLIIVRVSKFLD